MKVIYFSKEIDSDMKSFILILILLTTSVLAGGPTLDEQYELNMERANTSITATKYPIILHHGLFGFRQLLFVEYFHQVPKTLREAGFDVYTTEAYAFGEIDQKSRELADQIDHVLKLTGKDKVNIIAHSMGGLDARKVISVLGYEDKVASLSMIGTPHRGSYIADLVTGVGDALTKSKVEMEELEEVMVKLFVSHNPDKGLIMDALGAVSNLTQDFLNNTFNSNVVDSPKVYYQSWSGRTGRALETDKKDVVDGLLWGTYGILKQHDGENDGMVALESAKWGNYRGVLEADHLDMIGFFMGDTSVYFDHKEFYKNIALELGEMGF